MSTTAQLHDDVARYRGALLALDPGMPREQWVRAAMAAEAAGIASSDFDDWRHADDPTTLEGHRLDVE